MKDHRYEAAISWRRGEQPYTDNKYSRVHEWRFDGGAVVKAAPSPSIVPVPMTDPAGVDPEEALVAATSSCHMLFFLSFAAKAGFVVDSYQDDAFGVMGKNAAGRYAMTAITLRPRVQYAGTPPTAQQKADLHHRAHEACFIANSLNTEVLVAPLED
jgi:organic hydroperoxide reductase OsmC/OhrA